MRGNQKVLQLRYKQQQQNFNHTVIFRYTVVSYDVNAFLSLFW